MSAEPSRSVGRRIFWVITTTILILIFIAILVSLFGGGAFGVSELNRSFESLQTQIDANEQNLESLQSLVNSEFEAGAPRELQQDINNLQENVSSLDTDLATMQSDLANDLETQAEKLDALASSLATAVSDAEAMEANNSEGLLTLQTDLNQSNRRLDELGGELDALQADVDDANTAVSELETAYADNTITQEELQYMISLFRSWEMIARARLRLVENNFGLAEADAEQALRMIDFLIDHNAGENPDNLRIIQTRLALALSNLPDEPEQASTDLETAWNEIDKLLIIATFPEEEQGVILSTIPISEEVTIEDNGSATEVEAEATATPEATDDS